MNRTMKRRGDGAAGTRRPWRHRLVLGCLSGVMAGGLIGCSDGSVIANPIDIGPDRDQLKRSPCACIEIPPRPGRST